MKTDPKFAVIILMTIVSMMRPLKMDLIFILMGIQPYFYIVRNGLNVGINGSEIDKRRYGGRDAARLAMRDCVIVGGGLSAMLTACELVKEGMNVVVLEKGDIGREASWAGGGILSPLYPWRYSDAVTALALWSQRIYSDLTKTLFENTEIDPEWTSSGLLILGHNELEDAQAWSDRYRVKCHALDSEQTHNIEPALGRANSSIWLPHIAQVRNPRFLQALKKYLEAKGVALLGQHAVSELILESGRVRGVVAAGERIKAERVILAAGAWTSQLIEDSPVKINVFPVRGQMILFRAQADMLTRIILSQGHYVIPRRDGRVLAGSTLEYVGFDKSTTENAKSILRTAALALVPGLADFPIEHHWAGLRPGSEDGIPIIGEHPTINGLFINAGHFRNGVVLGPAAARLLVDLIIGREPIVDPRPYCLKSDVR